MISRGFKQLKDTLLLSLRESCTQNKFPAATKRRNLLSLRRSDTQNRSHAGVQRTERTRLKGVRIRTSLPHLVDQVVEFTRIQTHKTIREESPTTNRKPVVDCKRIQTHKEN